ncbi:ArsR/SmtB family transcription factor [Weissella cibaria]
MAQEQALLQAVAGFYKVLGNESRLAILHYMVMHPGPVYVSELVAQTGIAQPTVSKHLAILYQNHVVTRETSGNRVYYEIYDQHLKQTVEATFTHLEHMDISN